MYEYEDDRPATRSEAVREWAGVVGSEQTDRQWLLSDYDTWERNPHYTGPDQRHPEDYGIDEELTEDERIELGNAALDHYHDELERDHDEPYDGGDWE